jgi:hypothetical protein
MVLPVKMPFAKMHRLNRITCSENQDMTKSRTCILWLISAFLLAPFVVPFLPVFGPLLVGINCEQQDINIRTGQARSSRSLWFLKVSERIKETSLSQALNGETIQVANINPWQHVNTFVLRGKVSPNYVFHGAFNQAEQFGRIQSDLNFGPKRNREIARTILTAWQESGRASGAEAFIRKLIEEGTKKRMDAQNQ